MKSLLTLLLLCISCVSSFAVKQKMNVLFIISDDLTTTAVSIYGGKAKTPNIDALAKQGTMFTNTYSQFPVCGPSRASFMTGYYPHATKAFGYISGRYKIGNQRKTWSQHFKDNGYYTARISKIYHMGVPIDIETGSDGQDDPLSWTEKFNSQGPEWQALGDGELVENNPQGDKAKIGGNHMTIVKADGDDLLHSDGKTAVKASELLRNHKNEAFFLAVGLVRPHVPFVAPRKYFELYPYKDIELPETTKDDWLDIPDGGINYRTTLGMKMTKQQKQKAIAAYYASVSYMDAQVGKILTTLKEEGLEDNTIVVFTSDHGFFLGEHDFWMKVGLMDESARVPLIIKVPGKKAQVAASFTELIDLFPTTAALAGLNIPDNIQGKSLIKMFDNPDYSVRDAAFSTNKKNFLLRTKQWAYIQHGEPAKDYQLYDMVNDPKQFTNLAKNPEYKDVIAMFEAKMKQKLIEVRTNDLGIDYYKKTNIN